MDLADIAFWDADNKCFAECFVEVVFPITCFILAMFVTMAAFVCCRKSNRRSYRTKGSWTCVILALIICAFQFQEWERLVITAGYILVALSWQANVSAAGWFFFALNRAVSLDRTLALKFRGRNGTNTEFYDYVSLGAELVSFLLAMFVMLKLLRT